MSGGVLRILGGRFGRQMMVFDVARVGNKGIMLDSEAGLPIINAQGFCFDKAVFADLAQISFS